MLTLRYLIRTFLPHVLTSLLSLVAFSCASAQLKEPPSPVEVQDNPAVKKLFLFSTETNEFVGECTAFAVAPTKLISSAHCFVNAKGEANRVAIISSGMDMTDDTSFTTEIYAFPCYHSKGYENTACDIVVLTSSQPVVRPEEALTIDWGDSYDGEVTAVGFPGDPHILNQISAPGVLTHGKGDIYSFTSLVVGGMSGSPLIHEGKVVGIVSKLSRVGSLATALNSTKTPIQKLLKE